MFLGLAGAGEAADSRIVSAPVLEAARGAEYDFGGFVGDRLRANVRNWLLTAPAANPAMLQMFRDRDRAPARDLVPWAGEFAGKYLISGVEGLRLTNDGELRAHLGRFVGDLVATQGPDGYLGPFGKDRRMTGKGLWDLWGQYHCMLGLLLWHRQTGDPAALAACRAAADLFCRTFLDEGQRVVQAGSEEMNESAIHVFCLLFEETGEGRYLRMAREIERDWQMPPSGDYLRSALAGKAFYQCPKPRWESLPGIQAMAELYFITGADTYRQAFERTWWSIAEFDRHNTGGFSSGEQATGNPYDPRAIETCCTIAWSALTVDRLRLSGDARAADELEWSFYNAVLGAQNAAGAWWTYNTPMDGERKASAHEIVFQARAGSPELNCCSVNGPRGLGMLSDWALMSGRDAIVVNYYGPGRFTARTPAGGRVQLEQATDYPRGGRIALKLAPQKKERFVLALRIPGWSRRSTVAVNGEAAAPAEPGRYLRLDREWKRGDTIDLELDMSTRLWVGEREARDKVSIFHGPLLLAYDPRFDAHDPARLPEVDVAGTPAPVAPRPETILLLRYPGRAGQGITLCDFASAGMAGNRYVSWLPARGLAPAPFARENPMRAQWPGGTGR